ncbi:MAG: fibronectin type III domain-containing protein [Lachnospiraceae bacterium]
MKKRSYRLMSLLLILSLVILPFSGTVSVIKAMAASLGENPAYTFTSTDGNEVSTTVTKGQPTVIILGNTTCGNTQGTLKDIASSSWIGSGKVRVIFGDLSGKNLEEIKTFKQNYGCSQMIFCYDDNPISQISKAWNSYLDLVMARNLMALPTIVIIDGNNQVIDILSGYQTASTIINIINGNSSDDTPGDVTGSAASVTVDGTENYDFANDVLALVNQTRAEKGVAPLKFDESLLETAMQRAAELSLYYSHTRPDGSDCFTASSHAATRRSENIAIGYNTPDKVMNGWINSPGHYANIMDAEVTSIGIGCFINSEGIYNWVQFFDNGTATEPSVSGEKQVTRKISIQKEKLHLFTEVKQDFPSTDVNKEVKMDIYNLNEEFNDSKTKLPSSNFDFTCTGSAVSAVSEDGTITLGKSGYAKVTASLKSDNSVSITRTVTINGASVPDEEPVPGTTTKPDATTNPKPFIPYPYIPEVVTPEPATPVPATPEPATATPVPATPAPTPAVTPVVTPAPVVPTQAPAETTPEPETKEPVVPDVTGIKASTGTNNIKLTWDEAPGVNGYIVYQYNNTKKTWNTMETTEAGTVSYNIKKLSAASSYRFAVKAYIIQNGKEYTSKSYTSVYTATKPKKVNFHVTSGNKKAVIKWDKVKGADGYTVYYKNNKKDSWKKLKATKNTSYTAKKLKTGKTYFFTVKAYKNYKDKTYTGSGSSKKVKIK